VIWVLVAIVAVIVVWAVADFNGLVTLRNRVDNGWSEIDVQLRRRYDLIPNLVESVKGYAAHEREVFEDVTNARTAAMGTQGLDKASAENQITAGLGRLFAVAENYPDLKANQNFLALQEELTGTESKIAYARQFYNDEVMKLNTKIQRFPSSIIAGAFHFTPRRFFQIDDPAARGPVQVSF
jgi:LemA protein